jgi:hypothetical protein
MEHARRLFATGKNLESGETDLDIAQVRAGTEGTSVLWEPAHLALEKGGGGMDGWMGR